MVKGSWLKAHDSCFKALGSSKLHGSWPRGNGRSHGLAAFMVHGSCEFLLGAAGEWEGGYFSRGGGGGRTAPHP